MGALTPPQFAMLKAIARPSVESELGIGITNRTAAALVRLGLIERDHTRPDIGYHVHFKMTVKGSAVLHPAKDETE